MRVLSFYVFVCVLPGIGLVPDEEERYARDPAQSTCSDGSVGEREDKLKSDRNLIMDITS